MGSVAFLKACLGWVGGAMTVAALAAAVLEIGKSRASAQPGRLGTTWAKIAATPWSEIGRRSSGAVLAFFDRTLERVFTRADEAIVANVAFVGLIFVALPGLAIVNALVGGSPRLALYCLTLAAAFVVLNFSAESGALRGLNAAATLYLGFGLYVGIPVYVFRSFADRLLKETIDHAVIESVLVAPLVFIVAQAGFALFGAADPRRAQGAVSVEPIAAFAAAVPASFVLTFVALFLGDVAEAPESLERGWPLLLAAMACGSAALPITLGCHAAALRSPRFGAVAGAIVASLAAAAALSVALWWWAYGPSSLSFRDMMAVMLGRAPNGRWPHLGPEFWVLHIPFAPALAFVAGLVGAFHLKAVAALLNRLAGPGFAARRPLAAGGFGLAVVAVAAIAGSLWL